MGITPAGPGRSVIEAVPVHRPATRDMLAEGVTPTVEEAAAAARVSRTTAYRYFANQRLLVAAAHPEIERESLLPVDAPADPIARAHLVIDGAVRIVLDWEPQLRAALRLALEPTADPEGPVLRRGRVIGWLLDALGPFESTRPDLDLRRIAVAVRAATGIEAFVWLVDVAGYSRDDAATVLRDNGRAVLGALTADPQAGRPDVVIPRSGA